MTTIKGIELDLLRSSNNDFNWELVFTSGSFLSVNTSIQLEPSLIRLNKRDYTHCNNLPCLYSVYYNPIYDQYSIIDQNEPQDECHSNGYLIGGFQIKNCRLFFVYPNNCEGVQYERNFTSEYNKSFALTEFNCTDEECGDFNDIAFNESYDTSCIITETVGSVSGCGGFSAYNFDNEFTNSSCIPSNNFSSDFDSGYTHDGTTPSTPTPTPVPPIPNSRSFDLGFNSGFGA